MGVFSDVERVHAPSSHGKAGEATAAPNQASGNTITGDSRLNSWAEHSHFIIRPVIKASAALATVLALLGGCATPEALDPAFFEVDAGRLPAADVTLNIPGLGPCTDNPVTGLFQSPGSLGIYNSAKTNAATLAQLVANNTSSSLGVSNRGTKVDNSLAVLKTTTSRMTAIIIEVARLSTPDDDIVHASGATARAANGIRAGINAFINQ